MYFKASDLAKMFDVSPQTIRREYNRKKLHGFCVGNELRFTQQDIDDYTCILENHKTLREIELETEIKNLKAQIKNKNELIDSIIMQLMQSKN